MGLAKQNNLTFLSLTFILSVGGQRKTWTQTKTGERVGTVIIRDLETCWQNNVLSLLHYYHDLVLKLFGLGK